MNEKLKQSFESREDYGKNVEILLKFIRHGERDKVGNLMDLGREITVQRARESGLKVSDFDAAKAIGSNAAPRKNNMGRSFETADIYTHEIAGDEQFNSRVNDVLNYETIVNKTPFNHVEVYNKNLPDNFEELEGEERVKAAKVAQAEVVNYLVSLNTPEAVDYKKEIAGAFSYVVEHYGRMTKKLYSGSKVLLVAGTHGGLMEFLLQQAVVLEKNGKKQIGFSDMNDIGGEFSPSESYDVIIKTDEQGELDDLQIKFDNPNRPQGYMTLDKEKLSELSEYYKSLHKDI